jgi:hypothetical protein
MLRRQGSAAAFGVVLLILTDPDPPRQRLAVADRVSFAPFELYRNPPGVWQVSRLVVDGKNKR